MNPAGLFEFEDVGAVRRTRVLVGLVVDDVGSLDQAGHGGSVLAGGVGNLGGEAVLAIGLGEDRHRVHRAPFGVLPELGGRKRTVGRPNLGVARCVHAVEGLLADADRDFEALGLHGVGAVVAAALHGGGGRDAGDLANEVASLEADGLGAKVAGGVVADVAGGGLEVLVESLFLADRPQELRRVHHGVGDGGCLVAIGVGDKFGVLLAQHHRAGRVDGEHLLASLDMRQQLVEVGAGLLLHGVEIARLPCRHAAAIETSLTGDVDLVVLQHLDGVFADLGFVVLHVAGLEQHGLAIGGVLADQALGSRPLLEGLAGEAGQFLFGMDPECLLEELPVDLGARVEGVGGAEAGSCGLCGAVGIAEHLVAQGDLASLLGALRLVAVHQLGEVEEVLVLVAHGVRALDLAQLALEALVHHLGGLGLGDLADVAVVAIVDEGEQRREAVAVLEAHAAAVTDLEGALDLLGERTSVPVHGFRRVIGQAVSGGVGDGAVAHGGYLSVSLLGSCVVDARSGDRVEHLLEATRVALFGLGKGLEPVGDLVEALFAGGLRHARVHLGVLVGLAGDGALEVGDGVAHGLVGGGVADRLQVVEVAVRVAGLAFGGLTEVAGDLGVALDVGNLREVQVAAVGLRLAGEGGLQVAVGLGAVQFGHWVSSLKKGLINSGRPGLDDRGAHYPWFGLCPKSDTISFEDVRLLGCIACIRPCLSACNSNADTASRPSAASWPKCSKARTCT